MLVTKEQSSGEQAYKLWARRFEAVRKWRLNQKNGDLSWIQYRKLVAGEHWSVEPEGGHAGAEDLSEKPSVNKLGSLMEDFQAFLYNRDPRWVVRPRPSMEAQHRKAAEIQASLLNYYWVEQKMKKQAARAVGDILIIGHGIMRTGYDPSTPLVQTKPGQPSYEYEDYRSAGAPYIRRVNPFLFYWSPSATEYDLESSRWCVEVKFRPLEDIVYSQAYSNKALQKKIGNNTKAITQASSFLKAYDTKTGTMRGGAMYGDDDLISASDDPRVILEIWDKKFRKVYTMAHGIDDDVLDESAWLYDYLEGFPYIEGRYVELNDQHLAVGLPQRLKDTQLELTRNRASMVKARRQNSRVIWGAVKNGLSDPEKAIASFKSGEDDLILMERPNSITPFPSATLPPIAMEMERVLKEDMRELAGQDQLMTGGSMPSRTSAAEIRERKSIMGTKLDARVDQVNTFIHAVGRQILQHMKGNLTTNDVMLIEGIKGADGWKASMSPLEIEAETDVIVETTVKPEVDPVTDRNQRVAFLQTLGQIAAVAPQTMQQLNAPELVRWVAESFHDFPMARIFPSFSEGPTGLTPTPSPPSADIPSEQPVDPNSFEGV